MEITSGEIIIVAIAVVGALISWRERLIELGKAQRKRERYYQGDFE